KKMLSTFVEEKDTVYFVDFEMIPYNRPVILENIFFDFDKAELRPESKEELDGLIGLLNDNPSITIELSAHTDRKGAEGYNQDLSLRRAQSVVRYLIGKGVDERRLSAAGFGKTQPKTVSATIAEKYGFLKEGDRLDEAFIEKLTPEQQEIADQINRRTEFRVTGSSFGLF
ncbi:MAG: OmpA family protein, partial [Petrimonas sp.]|uniref:OmpA family protein n=1 Tax=Petrimonas sp. TaxID=2023866 RepID=UPI002B370A6F|nr:OmpA family protein [Petrimonas sp.]